MSTGTADARKVEETSSAPLSSPAPFSHAVLPLLCCYVALGLLLYVFQNTGESIITFDIRLLVGTLTLGLLTYVQIRPFAGRLIRSTAISAWAILGAVSFGFVLLSIPFYFRSAGVSFARPMPLASYQPYSIDDMAVWIAVLLIVFYALAEEFYFRGLIYRAFRAKTGISISVLASSLVFAAAHLQTNAVYIVSLVALGIFSAIVYEYTGTLLLGFVAHVTTDIGVVLMGSIQYEPMRPSLTPLVAAVAALIGSLAIIRVIICLIDQGRGKGLPMSR